VSVDGQAVRVERPTDDGLDVYALAMPAVVGVKEGINLPRYPTMKGRLASKKIAVTVIEPAAAAGGQRLVSLHTPVEQASTTQILGSGPDAAGAVVDLLTEIGVLP
jgi:electron transfer flavoprotein beta subunit